MPFDFTVLQEKAKQEIGQADSAEVLENLRIKYLGRQGLLAEITAVIPTLELKQRPEFGRKTNLFKNAISQLLEEKAKQMKEQKTATGQGFDFSLPGIIPESGRIHPITQTIDEICSIFTRMGFVVVEGPEIETEYNNFTGLNIPLEHPSRDAFDTFYIKPQAKDIKSVEPRLLLRSHTSPVQIQVMKKYRPPLAVIVPGKVYRPDAVDASHSFMFHQVEGFIVDEKIKFSDLKGILSVFVKFFFGENVKTRLRSHFFPFTEPSAEVDISCIICRGQDTGRLPVRQAGKTQDACLSGRQARRCSVCGGKGWLEILGCGMIHPNVFANVGYPKDRYSGFAFGMGVDRIAMLKYGINDIRLFYENDLRFLRQF